MVSNNRVLAPALAALLAACAAGPPGAQRTTAPAAEPALAPLLVVLNKSDSTASLVDTRSGETLEVLEVGRGPHEVAVDPSGRTAVVADYGDRLPGSTLTVLDLVERRVVRTIELAPHRRPHGIVFLACGRRVAVTTEGSRRLLVVDVEAGEVEAEMDTGQRVSHMVAVEPSGRLAFVANIGSGSVSVLDMEARERVAVVETGAGAEGVAVHPVEREVWVTNRAEDTVSVLDMDSLKVTHTIPCASFPIRIAFTPSGRHALVSCARSGDLAVVDTEKREVVRRLSMALERVGDEERDRRLFGDRFGESPVPIGIVVDPSGLRAYVANSNADAVVVVDLVEWAVVGAFPTGREPDGVALAAPPG